MKNRKLVLLKGLSVTNFNVTEQFCRQQFESAPALTMYASHHLKFAYKPSDFQVFPLVIARLFLILFLNSPLNPSPQIPCYTRCRQQFESAPALTMYASHHLKFAYKPTDFQVFPLPLAQSYFAFSTRFFLEFYDFLGVFIGFYIKLKSLFRGEEKIGKRVGRLVGVGRIGIAGDLFAWGHQDGTSETGTCPVCTVVSSRSGMAREAIPYTKRKSHDNIQSELG